MATDEIHVGDIGTEFELTIVDGGIPVDISLATIKDVIFKRQRANAAVKNGTFVTDGTDGKIRYTTVLGDLDVDGVWEIQGFVSLPSGAWSSEVDSFVVHPNLT